MDQVRLEKMNANEPLMKCRENEQPHQNCRHIAVEGIKCCGDLLLAHGGRHKDGMISIQA